MKKIILISLLSALMLGCQKNEKFQTIERKDFSLKVPLSMKDFSGQMADSAVLEMADTVRKIFVVIEKHPKTKNDSNAFEALVKYYIEDNFIDSSVHITSKKTKYGKAQILQAETIDLLPDLSSAQTYWFTGLFPAADSYYVVWTWTERIYKPDNEKTLKKIVNSFKVE